VNRIWALVWLAASAAGVVAGLTVLGPALVTMLK
jgi:hypothetical protein